MEPATEARSSLEELGARVCAPAELSAEPLAPEAIEAELRASVIRGAKNSILSLLSMLDNPLSVARGLHLIEETAKTSAALLLTLGVSGAATSRRAGSYIISSPSPLTSAGGGAVSLLGNAISDEPTGPGTETYGAQMFGQLLAMAKPLLERLMGGGSRGSSSTTGFDIESLTRALSAARSGQLPLDIIDALESRLRKALEDKKERDETVAAGAAVGMAAGFAAGAGDGDE